MNSSRRLWIRERRRADIDAEHGAEPGVLADALVNHVLVDAAAPRIVLPRADREIVVSELAPDAEDLQPFGLVAVDQKVVSHGQYVGDAARHVPRQIVAPLHLQSERVSGRACRSAASVASMRIETQ